MKISKKQHLSFLESHNQLTTFGGLGARKSQKRKSHLFSGPWKRVKKALFVRTYDHQIFIKKHAKNCKKYGHFIPLNSDGPPSKFFLEGKDCRGGFNFWWNCSILGSWCQRCSLEFFFLGGGGGGLRDGTTTRRYLRYLYIYHIMP